MYFEFQVHTITLKILNVQTLLVYILQIFLKLFLGRLSKVIFQTIIINGLDIIPSKVILLTCVFVTEEVYKYVLDKKVPIKFH